MTVRIINADVMDGLAQLADESVHTCVTSPPYWGLRQYIAADAPEKKHEIGLEPTWQEHLIKLVDVFRQVRRVLRSDGTLWLNYGDAYANDGKWGGSTSGKHVQALHGSTGIGRGKRVTGFKPKDLMLMPERLAIALCDDGWYIRSRIIWAKPNPMPESVTDRPTKSHEHIWLMSKSPRYFFDADAIRTPLAPKTLTTFGTGHRAQGNDAMGSNKSDNWGKSVAVRKPKLKVPSGWDTGEGAHGSIHRDGRGEPEYREAEYAGSNSRDVWTIATAPFPEAHFATFPPELAERCIKAGCRTGGTVLDPFGGSGTTAMVADRLQRNAILIELSPGYAEMARKRVADDAPLFAEVSP